MLKVPRLFASQASQSIRTLFALGSLCRRHFTSLLGRRIPYPLLGRIVKCLGTLCTRMFASQCKEFHDVLQGEGFFFFDPLPTYKAWAMQPRQAQLWMVAGCMGVSRMDTYTTLHMVLTPGLFQLVTMHMPHCSVSCEGTTYVNSVAPTNASMFNLTVHMANTPCEYVSWGSQMQSTWKDRKGVNSAFQSRKIALLYIQIHVDQLSFKRTMKWLLKQMIT